MIKKLCKILLIAILIEMAIFSIIVTNKITQNKEKIKSLEDKLNKLELDYKFLELNTYEMIEHYGK